MSITLPSTGIRSEKQIAVPGAALNSTIAIALGLFFAFAIIQGNPNASLEHHFAAFDSSDNAAAQRQKSVSGGSVVGYFGLAMIGVLSILTIRPRAHRFGGVLAILCLSLLAWFFVSPLWSVSPGYTLRKLAALTLFIISAVGVARSCSVRDLGVVMLISSSIFVFVGLLAELKLGTFRPTAGYYRFTGITHANSQAVYCAFMVLGSLMVRGHSPRFDRFRWLFIGVGFVMLVLTGSRTTTLALIVGLAVTQLFASDFKNFAMKTSLFVAFVSACLLFASSSAAVIDKLLDAAVMGRADHVTSLTGRVPLWQEVIRRSEDKLWFGHGFSTFWNARNIEEISNMFYWYIPSGHSIYIDMLASLGLVGLVLTCLILVMSVVKSHQVYRRDANEGNLYRIAFFVFAIIQGIAESKFIGIGMVGFFANVFIVHLCMTPVAGRLPNSHAVKAHQ